MTEQTDTFSSCAYCWKNEPSWDGLLHYKCEACNKKVHYDCIKSSQPSPLQDDTFFNFTCEGCSQNGKEEFERMKISWQDIVALTLYHLQRTTQGRCGFFHWKANICAFIDAQWRHFFGLYRKKTTLWMGTVAGTLSSGCPEIFTSGASAVETGYWRLAELKPPLPFAEKKKTSTKKKTPQELPAPLCLNPEDRRARKPKDNALTAAMELKEKQVSSLVSKRQRASKKKTKAEETTDSVSKSKRRSKAKSVSDEILSVDKDEGSVDNLSILSSRGNMSDADDTSSISSSLVSQRLEIDFPADILSGSHLDLMNVIKVEAADEDDDLDIDIGSFTTLDGMTDFRPESPDVNDVLNSVNLTDDNTNESGHSSVVSGKCPVSQKADEPATESQVDQDMQEMNHPLHNLDHQKTNEGGDEGGQGNDSEGETTDDAEEEDSEEGDDDGSDDGEKSGNERQPQVSRTGKKRGRPRKRRRSDDAPPPSPPQRLKRISVFEERELLQKINVAAKQQPLRPELAQLRRKLICNQTNREFSLPVFDLDRQVEKLTSKEKTLQKDDHLKDGSIFMKQSASSDSGKETRDLDRFMMHDSATKAKSRTYTSFSQRLVGFEDNELKPFVSPYTTRVLVPFIWRNYNPTNKPLKLRLLEEIQAYPHRNDPTWQPPSSPPIDFCYVRPEHIPSVNALCREFFWPGIDVSECLQYPDFSCVVLYKKIVIGFAFMVPDRGYNEAYISFVFTHPEWRGAGIASFMIYHLIQTCMGKDVLLHVSVTNPAMLLYQQFGFKAQELIKNFYYKYFPFDSKDSTHAFLMRLTR